MLHTSAVPDSRLGSDVRVNLVLGFRTDRQVKGAFVRLSKSNQLYHTQTVLITLVL